MFEIKERQVIPKPEVFAAFMLPWLVQRRFEKGEITEKQRDRGYEIIQRTWDKYYGN